MKTVGDIIAAHQDEILADWIRATADSQAARRLTQRELAGGMPAFLASLGRTAAGGAVQLAPDQMQAIERHLAARVHHGFTRNEVLAEIASLGGFIARVLEAQAEAERPAPEEVRQLLAELYLTSLAVASTFDQHGVHEVSAASVAALMHDLSGSLDVAQASATSLLDRTTGDAHRAATSIARELERTRELLSALADVQRVRVGEPLPSND